MIKGITGQRIIQGKTFSFRLRFRPEDIEKISKIWFSSSELGIVKELDLDSETNIYSFNLSWQETQNLKPINTTFNVTVQLVGLEKARDLANGIELTVVKNKNQIPAQEA